MDYKIETKPSLWEVMLSHGSYSERDESNYFIQANDREEAWYLFKKYWDTILGTQQAVYCRPILVLLGTEKQEPVENYIPEDWRKHITNYKQHRAEPDLDTDEGMANNVQIYPVNVIRFKK